MGLWRASLIFYKVPHPLRPAGVGPLKENPPRDEDPAAPLFRDRARKLRREATEAERKLWSRLRYHRMGVKFRRQHPAGKSLLDFYCAYARLSIELDGFHHGLPAQRQRDVAREQFLAAADIEELRFWNHQWRNNPEGVLLEIWHALHRRTGCVAVVRKVQNHRYVPPDPKQLTEKHVRRPN